MVNRIRKNSIAIGIVMILFLVVLYPMSVIAFEDKSLQENGFHMNGTTLVKYTGTEKSVSIPDTVKKIGESAFEGNTTMEKVVLSKTTEEIGYSAFADCTGLKTVVLSDTVSNIENSAFSNCIQLTNFNFGKGVKKIGIGILVGCDQLEEISIDEENESFLVKDGALYNGDQSILYQVFAGRKKDSFRMPSSVKTINPYAFWGCDSIKQIFISDSIEEVSAYSFSNCKSLQSVEIPYSVNRIGLKAFEDCVNLRKTIIGPNVVEIHETAFDGCLNLYIDAQEGTVADRFSKEHDLIKTDQVEYEDTGCDEKENETDNQQVSGEDTAFNLKGLLADTYVVGNKAVVFIDNSKPTVLDGSEQENILEQSENELENQPNFELNHSTDSIEADKNATKGFSIPKLKMIDGKKIADQAYYKDLGLTKYEIPKGIQTIGEFSFARSGIKEIEIPNGVTTIDYAAFYHCDSLYNITIPNSVKEISAKAFDKTKWMENWIKNSDDEFLIVGDGILIAYKGYSPKVVLPDGVKRVAPEVFLDHQEIEEITLPDSLLFIDEKAFCDCSSLERIIGGTSVQKIADRAYYNCPLKTVRIPKTVNEIGVGAFSTPDCKFKSTDRVAVFYGDRIPTLTFADSAYRLSDYEARSLALGEIGTVVVMEGINEFENTVLDFEEPGFLGIICSSPKNNKDVLTCIASTLSENEIKNCTFEEDIYLYEKKYKIENLEDINDFAVQKEKDFTYEGKVLFSVDCQLFENDSLMNAKLEGNTSEYYLRIENDKDAKENIRKAYYSVYQSELEDDVYGFDMKFIDASTGIPIQKLGRQLLQITLPVPKQLEGKTFRLVCLDKDGQLESIDYTLREEEQNLFITFEMNHFSTFGFYVTGEVPEGADRTLATNHLDDSPDTGDFIHPAVIFIVGSLFLTVALWIIGNRKKTSGIS